MCIAVYPGDWAVALSAFDTEVDVLGPNGQRTIALDDLYRGPGTTPNVETVLEFSELILRIRVRVTPLGRASTYHKIRDRESFAFALASAAVALQMDGDTVREVRIAVGGLATRPWRARAAEQALVGRTLTASSARASGEAALQGAEASNDNRFRIELGIRTVADALMIAKQRALRQ
jgi:xanthine dehydrogenase YagS FAD-binding subunit